MVYIHFGLPTYNIENICSYVKRLYNPMYNMLFEWIYYFIMSDVVFLSFFVSASLYEVTNFLINAQKHVNFYPVCVCLKSVFIGVL